MPGALPFIAFLMCFVDADLCCTAPAIAIAMLVPSDRIDTPVAPCNLTASHAVTPPRTKPHPPSPPIYPLRLQRLLNRDIVRSNQSSRMQIKLPSQGSSISSGSAQSEAQIRAHAQQQMNMQNQQNQLYDQQQQQQQQHYSDSMDSWPLLPSHDAAPAPAPAPGHVDIAAAPSKSTRVSVLERQVDILTATSSAAAETARHTQQMLQQLLGAFAISGGSSPDEIAKVTEAAAASVPTADGSGSDSSLEMRLLLSAATAEIAQLKADNHTLQQRVLERDRLLEGARLEVGSLQDECTQLQNTLAQTMKTMTLQTVSCSPIAPQAGVEEESDRAELSAPATPTGSVHDITNVGAMSHGPSSPQDIISAMTAAGVVNGDDNEGTTVPHTGEPATETLADLAAAVTEQDDADDEALSTAVNEIRSGSSGGINGSSNLKTLEVTEYIEIAPRGDGLGFAIVGGLDAPSSQGGGDGSETGIFISDIFVGGSAAIDGRLQIGDKVVRLNGIPTVTMRHDQAVENLTSLIVGNPCTLLVSRAPAVNQEIVTIKVSRGADGLGFSVIGGVSLSLFLETGLFCFLFSELRFRVRSWMRWRAC